MAYQKDSRARTKVKRRESNGPVRDKKDREPKQEPRQRKVTKSKEASLPKRSLLEIWNSWFVSNYVLQSPLKPWEIEEELLKVTDLNRSAPFGSLDYTEPKYFIGQIGNDTFYVKQQQTNDFSTPHLRGSYTASEKGSTIYLISEYPDIARYATGTVIGIFLVIILLIPKDFDWPAKVVGIALLMGLVMYFVRLGFVSVRKANFEKFREVVKGEKGSPLISG